MYKTDIFKLFLERVREHSGVKVSRVYESRRIKTSFIDEDGSQVTIVGVEIWPVNQELKEENMESMFIFDVIYKKDGKTIFPDTYEMFKKGNDEFFVAEGFYPLYSRQINNIIKSF